VSDAVVERLDQILAVLRLANAEALNATSARMRAEPAKNAALDACADDWVGAGELTKAVMAKTNLGNSTVRGHIADLLTAGALARDGSGPKTRYKSTGVI
jgi:hypothetical protein